MNDCGHAAAIMRSGDGYWHIQPNIHLWSNDGRSPAFHLDDRTSHSRWAVSPIRSHGRTCRINSDCRVRAN